MGSHDKDKLRRPPSIAEWQDMSCDSLSAEEEAVWTQLGTKRVNERNLSEQESRFARHLDEKFESVIKCQLSLMSNQRRRLPPP